LRWRYDGAGEIHNDGSSEAPRLFGRVCSRAWRSSLTLPSVMRWQRRLRLRLAPCADTWRPLISARRMKARRCRIPPTSQKRRFESCRWTCLVPARLNPARTCSKWLWFERSSSPLTAIQTAYVVAVMRMLNGADGCWISSSSITRRPSLIGSLRGSSPVLAERRGAGRFAGGTRMDPENLRGFPVDDELRLRERFVESRRACESAGQRHLTVVVPRCLNVWTTVAPSPDSRPHLVTGRWVKGRACSIA
jgi:hypothetical protein